MAGLALTIAGFHRTFGPELTHYVDVAKAADEVGIDQVILADHVVMGRNTDKYPYGDFPFAPEEPWADPLVLLTAIAARPPASGWAPGSSSRHCGRRPRWPRPSPPSTPSRADGSTSASAPAGSGRSTTSPACRGTSAGAGSTTACGPVGPCGPTARRRSRRRASASPTSGARRSPLRPAFRCGSGPRPRPRTAPGWRTGVTGGCPSRPRPAPTSCSPGIAALRAAFADAGRSPDELLVRFGMPFVRGDDGFDFAATREAALRLADAGVTHFSVNLRRSIASAGRRPVVPGTAGRGPPTLDPVKRLRLVALALAGAASTAAPGSRSWATRSPTTPARSWPPAAPRCWSAPRRGHRHRPAAIRGLRQLPPPAGGGRDRAGPDGRGFWSSEADLRRRVRAIMRDDIAGDPLRDLAGPGHLAPDGARPVAGAGRGVQRPARGAGRRVRGACRPTGRMAQQHRRLVPARRRPPHRRRAAGLRRLRRRPGRPLLLTSRDRSPCPPPWLGGPWQWCCSSRVWRPGASTSVRRPSRQLPRRLDGRPGRPQIRQPAGHAPPGPPQRQRAGGDRRQARRIRAGRRPATRRDVAIVELGAGDANDRHGDARMRRDIRQVLYALRHVPCVRWLSLKIAGVNGYYQGYVDRADDFNRILAQEIADYPNARVAPYRAVVRGPPRSFKPDGLHHTARARPGTPPSSSSRPTPPLSGQAQGVQSGAARRRSPAQVDEGPPGGVEPRTTARWSGRSARLVSSSGSASQVVELVAELARPVHPPGRPDPGVVRRAGAPVGPPAVEEEVAVRRPRPRPGAFEDVVEGDPVHRHGHLRPA